MLRIQIFTVKSMYAEPGYQFKMAIFFVNYENSKWQKVQVNIMSCRVVAKEHFLI